MQRLQLIGLGLSEAGVPLLLLTTEDGRLLPLGVGPAEAASIAARLGGAKPERPFTHDLLSTILSEVGAEVKEVAITELRDHAFHALITLGTPGGEIGVDARPSDAIALAVRTDAPIFCSDQVIDEASITTPVRDEKDENDERDAETLLDDFRSFLDGITPDDFLPSTPHS